ncbi:MAG: ATPase [Bacteroidales bacterium]|nr:ATPase [Bacteroidales bacterium]MDD4671499.1 ATPase [Bacteroidales bacterium]MDY0349323.1 ATPase [Tenuifilaceae bacterium]
MLTKISLSLTVLMFWFAQGFSVQIAQEQSKSTEFKVYGECGMCKTRIENAAKIEGVKSASWDKESQMLKIDFNPTLVKLTDIHKNIAKVGHDTDKEKAEDGVYKKLPPCCKYERP